MLLFLRPTPPQKNAFIEFIKVTWTFSSYSSQPHIYQAAASEEWMDTLQIRVRCISGMVSNKPRDSSLKYLSFPHYREGKLWYRNGNEWIQNSEANNVWGKGSNTAFPECCLFPTVHKRCAISQADWCTVWALSLQRTWRNVPTSRTYFTTRILLLNSLKISTRKTCNI